ncbi:40S ribosomal protein [Mycena indigotica]|uniref:40S ribosomal protein n=1 Tax=Mycena indigotica TaxID=2126181 RepID=A0A8H6SAE0_9AGAR|nr:40S ribosomal protein [Mycena indigotica]KAF7295076.1 40S ribosomal protein [Mycena indigotica]
MYRQSVVRRVGRSSTRHLRLFSEDTSLGERPIRTQDEWANHQVRRAEVGTLIDIFSNYGSNRRQETAFRLRDNIRRPIANATVSSLLAAGAHFGHANSRMNPNFLPYAYGTRAKSTIIDLEHTVPLLKRAANLVRAVAFAGGQILFVGTRPDLRQIVKAAAGRIGKQGYYISDRWIPGTLTNTIEMYSQQVVKETITTPDLVVLLNPLANITCISECALAHVPTIAIIDSDADPRLVMYPIPANDESPQTAEIIAGILSIAGREGLALRMEEEVAVEENEQEEQDEAFWDEVEAAENEELEEDESDDAPPGQGIQAEEDE